MTPVEAARSIWARADGAAPWWHALVSDAGTGVMVLDADGRVMFANEDAATFYAGQPAARLIGRGLYDFLPAPMAAERVALLRRTVGERRALRVSSMWHGVATRVTLRPIDGDHGTLALAVARLGEAPESPAELERDVERLDASCIDLGPMERLTVRELEVLALIGEGLSVAEMADQLHRSLKTIEGHRRKLGKKLAAKGRVELARIALRANLRGADPGLTARVRSIRMRTLRRPPSESGSGNNGQWTMDSGNPGRG